MHRTAVHVAALLWVVSVAGCSFTTQVNYQPIGHEIEKPDTTVALTVIDAREPDYGGTDKTQIGKVRGGYGNPFPLYETDSQKVALLVRSATEDALAHSRVAVQSGSPRTVVATVTEFWIDGYMGYKASVVVQCDLKDEQGTVLWSGKMSGSGGGMAVWTPTGFVEPTFQKALAEYAEQAMVQFNSPEFQKHLY